MFAQVKVWKNVQLVSYLPSHALLWVQCILGGVHTLLLWPIQFHPNPTTINNFCCPSCCELVERVGVVQCVRKANGHAGIFCQHNCAWPHLHLFCEGRLCIAVSNHLLGRGYSVLSLIMENVISLILFHVIPSLHVSPFFNLGIGQKLCWGHPSGVWIVLPQVHSIRIQRPCNLQRHMTSA